MDDRYQKQVKENEILEAIKARIADSSTLDIEKLAEFLFGGKFNVAYPNNDEPTGQYVYILTDNDEYDCTFGIPDGSEGWY